MKKEIMKIQIQIKIKKIILIKEEKENHLLKEVVIGFVQLVKI